jgi:DtxR family Mn-dependent transcriptional regulator
MSDAVERRILALLDKPLVCPHGNPIPGLEDLGLPFGRPVDAALLPTLAASVTDVSTKVRIERISENLQPDAELMRLLSLTGLTPGSTVSIERTKDGIQVSGGQQDTVVGAPVAEGIFVSVPA